MTLLLDKHFPQLNATGKRFVVEELSASVTRLRMCLHESLMRPGGTISGPALFHLADLSIYVALLAKLGEAAVPAATSNLSINFLVRPEPRDVIAEARLFRIGRRQAVGEVALYSEGSDVMLAHATGAYAIPSAAVR